MKLIQIQYFLAIVETGSITKAAETLFISQPALSKQMNLLEEELGVELLKRTTSGIVLTETGEEFAKDCRKVMKDLDKAVLKAVNAGQKAPEAFRIGCFDGAVTEDFLPPLYAYLREKAPGLRIKLGRHSTGDNRKLLTDGSIDMLIELRFSSGPQDPFHKGCFIKTLVKRRSALIYSENSPLAEKKNLKIKDFEKEIFLRLTGKDNDLMADQGFQMFDALGLSNPKFEDVDNFASLLSGIRLGEGFSPLSVDVIGVVPGLKAFELPEEMGIEVIAVWKKSNQFVTKLMKTYK